MALPVKFPKQVGPAFTQKIMPWVETFWQGKRRYPTTDEFMTQYTLTAEQVRLLNLSPFWIQACERRGIRLPEQVELSPKQVAAISLITNFTDRRSIPVKMAAIDVSEEELNGWYADPQFDNLLRTRTDVTLDTSFPEVQASLIKQVQKGNLQAIKFYYEITGRTKNEEAQNLRLIVAQLIEAVQKHVQDPDALYAIGKELESMQSIGRILQLPNNNKETA